MRWAADQQAANEGRCMRLPVIKCRQEQAVKQIHCHEAVKTASREESSKPKISQSIWTSFTKHFRGHVLSPLPTGQTHPMPTMQGDLSLQASIKANHQEQTSAFLVVDVSHKHVERTAFIPAARYIRPCPPAGPGPHPAQRQATGLTYPAMARCCRWQSVTMLLGAFWQVYRAESQRFLEHGRTDRRRS